MRKRRTRPPIFLAALAILALLGGLYAFAPVEPGTEARWRIPVPTATAPPTTPGGTGARADAPRQDPVPVAPPPSPLSPQRPPPSRAIDAEWERRAVPVTIAGQRPVIAVILDDMGLDRARALRAINLPAPLTLSFLPYGRDAPALAILARQRGHEVLLHMPMQPVGREDPGPQALTTELSAIEIRTRVGAAIDRFGDAIGLNNHMGSRFTAELGLMLPVMDELAARGLVFVDSRTASGTQGLTAALERGVPTILRDVFLDNELTAEAIARQLDEAERVARRRGAAVAIGHPHDATMAALAQWLPGLSERGLQAVPVTAVIRRAVLRGNQTR